MIAVMTCSRPGGVDYLSRTIASIDDSSRPVDDSSRSRRIVIGHGVSPVAPKHWETATVDLRGRGNVAPFRLALGLAALHRHDLVVCDDDVAWRPGAARFAEDFTVPADCAFVTLYDHLFDRTVPPGVWRSGAHSYRGSLATKIPHRTVLQVVDHLGFITAPAVGGNCDVALSALGTELGWLYGVCVPGLVQHAGDVSSLGNKPGRRSRSYTEKPVRVEDYR